MSTRRTRFVVATGLLLAATGLGGWLLAAGAARAHCDTMGGPIIPEAKAALEKGDVAPVLKWVRKEHEAEVRAAFARAVAVRSKGPEAKELADRYFLETLVRLHRAGEGAPFAGLKDEPVGPVVAMADKALADGSADEMVKKLGAHMTEAVKEKFGKAVEARKHKDDGVEAGRQFVAAYVDYVHYVEALHAAIVATGGHHAGAGEEAPAHRH